MKYEDIDFYPPSHYTTHTSWEYIEQQLADWNDRTGIPGNLGLNLDPDFQRGHVWSEQKQIEYVEYCLMGGESSRTLIFNHPNWQGTYAGEMVLVDGKQRLEAVRKFIKNELPVFDGHKLNDFEDPTRVLRSHNAHFIVTVHKLKTRNEILNFYLKLNSGGVVHTKDELDKVKKMIENEKA